MSILMRYRYHLLAALLLLGLILAGAKTKPSKMTQSPEDLPKFGETSTQTGNALELLPRAQAELALSTSGEMDRRGFILSFVQQSLNAADQGRAFQIANSVLVEAQRQKMDPLFLLAVIATESRFNLHARGSHGERGLMQILPSTAASLAKLNGFTKPYDLEEPSVNIRLGAAYLAHLRRSFHRNGKRYVAAYNMGAVNVRRLLKVNIEPGVYPAKVLLNYQALYISLKDTLQREHPGRSLASVR